MAKTTGNYICSDAKCQNPIKGFKCMKVSPVRQSQVIKAPVETGQKSFDNKVIEPLEVRVTGFVDKHDSENPDTVAKLNAMLANRKFEFYSVLTENDMYQNLILQSCPSTIDSGTPDLISYELVFVEAMLIQNRNNRTPANKQNTNTVKSGNTPLK